MKSLLIATKNNDKTNEVINILQDLDFEFKSLIDYPEIKQVEENGLTFKDNAEKKARQYSSLLDMLAVADDSGLEVDELDGRPGVFSSRFAGENASYKDNNDKLLKLLKDIPFKKRQARFVCYIAIANKGEIIGGCKGVCEGHIAEDSEGLGGFGYDPVFIPEGYDKTFACLGSDIKNKLSHRYNALVKAKQKLRILT